MATNVISEWNLLVAYCNSSNSIHTIMFRNAKIWLILKLQLCNPGATLAIDMLHYHIMTLKQTWLLGFHIFYFRCVMNAKKEEMKGHETVSSWFLSRVFHTFLTVDWEQHATTICPFSALAALHSLSGMIAHSCVYLLHRFHCTEACPKLWTTLHICYK